jgi:hypothetical protein
MGKVKKILKAIEEKIGIKKLENRKPWITPEEKMKEENTKPMKNSRCIK